jgi:hypothetical protein
VQITIPWLQPYCLEIGFCHMEELEFATGARGVKGRIRRLLPGKDSRNGNLLCNHADWKIDVLRGMTIV